MEPGHAFHFKNGVGEVSSSIVFPEINRQLFAMICLQQRLKDFWNENHCFNVYYFMTNIT